MPELVAFTLILQQGPLPITDTPGEFSLTAQNQMITEKSYRQFKGRSLWAFPDDYTVVDIETNGLASGTCEIIEVSAIKCRNNTPVSNFSSLIKPSESIRWFITKLTGITDDTVKSAPPAKLVLEKFYEFVGEDILVGHNVHFDVNFLYDELLKYNNLVLKNSFVDTLRLARKALPQLPNHRQTTVAEYYRIPTDGAHRALKDCEICSACYQRLKTELTHTLRDVTN